MISCKRYARIFFSVLMLAAGLSACSGGGKLTGTASTPALPCAAPTTATLPVIEISGPITTATTWNANTVYHITTSISIAAPLTIQPGAVVKFATTTAGGTNLTVNSGGSITANGNSSGSIVFTSYKDDSIGGDSNVVADTPAMGDWGKIILNSSGSTFSCAKFYYGGKTDATLQIGGNMLNSATIINSTFAHNNGANSSGLVTASSDALGALDASFASVGTVISGNTFYDNKVPLSISGTFSVNDSNTFQSSATSPVTNLYNGIFLVGGPFKNVTGSINLSETEVPHVFAGKIDVPNGSMLTLGDNAVIKFFDGSSSLYTNFNGISNASARITANATAANKIVFTSYRDDSHGGDTNGDGPSTGTVGDWARVALNADGSSFNQCEFYYGGSDATYRESLSLNTHQATVTNSLFVNNHGGAIGAEAGALNASNAKAKTVITGNTFYGNDVPLTMSGNFSIDDSNVFHNPANTLKNTYNGIFFTTSTSKNIYTISLIETEVPFVMGGDIFVKTGAILTTGNNVVLKFSGANTRLTFEGGLQQYQIGSSVKYTSLKDDTLLGDTNGDAALSSPVTADWAGIRLPGAGGTYVYLTFADEHYCSTCTP